MRILHTSFKLSSVKIPSASQVSIELGGAKHFGSCWCDSFQRPISKVKLLSWAGYLGELFSKKAAGLFCCLKQKAVSIPTWSEYLLGSARSGERRIPLGRANPSDAAPMVGLTSVYLRKANSSNQFWHTRVDTAPAPTAWHIFRAASLAECPS
ncbi:unnamed protein product [Darwinula stevensoni]|uniref:Uncharacterized protein n=1 Tax=Darwinula stevensoni TaxID=69355 RepID=A0A7R9A4U0_9CRUS|nr:unnamed protein product [Darwinula stevensoni]CAG0890660.1 unnamed protein product [Darwinula stevensoni]